MREWTDTFKNLRNVINANQKDDSDIQLKRGHFYMSVNGLCSKFKGTLLNSDVATRLSKRTVVLSMGAKPRIYPGLVFNWYAQHGIRLCEEFSIYYTIPIDVYFHL